MSVQYLIRLAEDLVGDFRPSDGCVVGGVASALVTVDSSYFTGVSVDTPCSLGFCAEHAAVGAMLKARQSRIEMVVAVRSDGRVVTPCGRCREFMWRVDSKNGGTLVLVSRTTAVPLRELLP